MNKRIEKFLALRNIKTYKKLYESINDSMIKTVINNNIVTLRFKKTSRNIKVTQTTYDFNNSNKLVTERVIH